MNAEQPLDAEGLTKATEALLTIEGFTFGPADLAKGEHRDAAAATVRAYLAALSAPTPAASTSDTPFGHEYGEGPKLADMFPEPAAPTLVDVITEAVSMEDGFTYGHCEEKSKPGGCQLHNLHCGYPDCDRRPTASTPAAPAERSVCPLCKGVGHEFESVDVGDGSVPFGGTCAHCNGAGVDPDAAPADGLVEPVAWQITDDAGTIIGTVHDCGVAEQGKIAGYTITPFVPATALASAEARADRLEEERGDAIRENVKLRLELAILKPGIPTTEEREALDAALERVDARALTGGNGHG